MSEGVRSCPPRSARSLPAPCKRKTSSALGHVGECEPCVQAGLLGPGRKASLDFYIDADIESCCLLDSEVQRALAGRTTSVLPPSLSLGVRPLASYVHESRGKSEAAVAARFRVSAKELMLLGGEMNQRLSVVCAYLSAL